MPLNYYRQQFPDGRTGLSTEDVPGATGGSQLAPPPPPPPPPTPPPPPPPPSPLPLPPAPPAPQPTPVLPRPTLPAPAAPVGVPIFEAIDYAAAARALMPRGRVWPTDPDSVQQLFLLAIGKTFERSDASAMAILAGSLPGSTVSGFLPEWEATLGLPDPCIGSSPTFAQRFAQVLARFVGAGGQSRAHYIAYAAALGFTITITTYSSAHPGPTGLGISGTQWNFVWGVTVVANASGLSSGALKCELDAVRPAETTIIML